MSAGSRQPMLQQYVPNCTNVPFPYFAQRYDDLAQQSVVVPGTYFSPSQTGFWNTNNSNRLYQQSSSQQSSPTYSLSSQLLAKIQHSPHKTALMEFQVGFEQIAARPNEFKMWADAIGHHFATNNQAASKKADLAAITLEILIEMVNFLPLISHFSLPLLLGFEVELFECIAGDFINL